jgi:hypothetical protein
MTRRLASVFGNCWLRELLDGQATEALADHRAGDGQRAGLQIHVAGLDGAGLADAQAGAQQEFDQVGQAVSHRGRVGGQQGPDLL